LEQDPDPALERIVIRLTRQKQNFVIASRVAACDPVQFSPDCFVGYRLLAVKTRFPGST
jgi:hypothetical protein